jgi:hypothetical protein
MLDKLDSWLNDFPPLENPQRFGNKAFRQWMEHLRQVVITNNFIYILTFDEKNSTLHNYWKLFC